jgi:predicted dehydrogenase
MRLNKVRVGLVGLGEVAQIIHLPILESLHDRFEITALCDISESLLQILGEKYRVKNLFTDARELAQFAELDAVFVLNSDEYHTECVVAAAENGKHVFVEKPVCLTMSDADSIIRARDEAGVQVMVGYMRRYAPAFVQGVEEVKTLGGIQYARIRDIIGQNRQMIEQSSVVHRPGDIPASAMKERKARGQRMVEEAIGAAPHEVKNAYRLLCGLSSHDLSAMREIIGFPRRVVSAAGWNNGGYITAILEFDGFFATFETGVDLQRRFDAHIEVYGKEKSIKVQYNTPYIRHLPTTLIVNETVEDAYQETVIRPTFKDAYTMELEVFYEVVTRGVKPKTTIEDYKEDLKLFKMITDALIHTQQTQQPVQAKP